MCSPGWLSPEPFNGQAQQNAAERKRELRTILRDSREKLKQQKHQSGHAWGDAHLNQLWSYFRKVGLADSPEGSETLQLPVASYWPISSELCLLPRWGHAQLRTKDETSLDSRICERGWWLPHMHLTGNLDWFKLEPTTSQWPQDKRGLPQPPSGTLTREFPGDGSLPFIVLTPCLAVDRSGIRLGYGGGYYDRFLAKYASRCLMVACAPRKLILESGQLPREDHDVCVDVIISEDEAWEVQPHLLKEKLSRFRQLLKTARG